MPNFENFKKQAKQYLRWHRERYYPVAARIRAALPRFRHLSDEQVLDANFKLADAQELVARERGFEGWQALKSGAHAMTHESTDRLYRALFSIQPKHNCSLPTSKHRAISIPKSSASRSPSSTAIRRSTGRSPATKRGLICGWSANRCSLGDIREREQLLSASLTVATAEEIKQLFLSYQAAGVRFHQKLKKEPWGARTFIVVDPDGNLILFAGPAD